MNNRIINNIVAILILGLLVIACNSKVSYDKEQKQEIDVADKYLLEDPSTLTDFTCDRSAGTLNDYYSEGDYWWPDSTNLDGPYIRKDGLTNPNNFVAHRKALRRLSIQVPALVAAYKITGDKKYAEKAIEHLKAWFIVDSTMMSPNLMFAQAIKGRVTGRGIGIIDTIHLVEVAKAIMVLYGQNAIDKHVYAGLQDWFSKYLNWLTKHKFGIAERDNGNNHSTCWAMQVGMFALLTDNNELLQYVREFYKNVLIEQMAEDGSFPKELSRTKPYGYSLFNLDAMVMVCEIASSDDDNLWDYQTKDGRGIKLGVEFMYPYIDDKTTWPYAKDVMYWDDWPVRQPSLLFASIHFNEKKFAELWGSLEANPTKDEIIRNYPIRQPLLWTN